MKKNNTNYKIITGCITDLQIFNTEDEFIDAHKQSGLTEIDLSNIGELKRVRTDDIKFRQNLSENDDPKLGLVQFFSCKIGTNVVEGVFSRIIFNEGDHVEIVAESMGDGSYFAFALHRTSDRYLFLHPYTDKGTRAYLNFGPSQNKIIFALSCIGILGLFILIYFFSISELPSFSVEMIFILCCLSILLCPSYIVLLKYKNLGSKIADKIFRTLGYQKPRHIDIQLEVNKFNDKMLESFAAFGYFKAQEGESVLQFNDFLEFYEEFEREDDTEDDIYFKKYFIDKFKIKGLNWFYVKLDPLTVPKEVEIINTQTDQID
ncbi:hypothetical protein FcAc13_01750 [Frischella sp. Ac13]|uniref:Uncharacterized protein n=1 Tax=Frischella japonica TaxID=2741544 RepID=A0ABR7QV03_9GAMM|nr:hypothetical protein [Frischella japonica]MBC9130031.1 hypothetical protein [Frischella japonica]